MVVCLRVEGQPHALWPATGERMQVQGLWSQRPDMMDEIIIGGLERCVYCSLLFLLCTDLSICSSMLRACRNLRCTRTNTVYCTLASMLSLLSASPLNSPSSTLFGSPGELEKSFNLDPQGTIHCLDCPQLHRH